MKQRIVIILSVLLFHAQVGALETEKCSEAAKTIDDRIATGSHSQQNINIATQVRDGIMQSCAFLDENTLAQMLQGIDTILPGDGGASAAPEKSAAEKRVERDAQRAEAKKRRAERDKRRAAKRAREEAEQGLISAVAKKPPTGKSMKFQKMSRPDTMWRATMVDWDLYKDKARLLYETTPSREQGRLPEAARHFYVIEFDTQDNIVQHHIFETTLEKTVTAGLLRGRDEIIVQRHEFDPETIELKNALLERWSISGAKKLSSSPAPTMQGPRGPMKQDIHFELVTKNGELLYTASVALESGPNPKSGVSWILASPDGEVRDQGMIVHENEGVATSNWFHTTNGGAGMVLDVSSVEENGIDSQLKPKPVQMGEAEVQPIVFSERRLYVAGDKDTSSSLPTIEKRLLWLGMEKVDQQFMLSGKPTQLMNEATDKYRVDDSAVSLPVAGHHRMVIAPTNNGHAILIRNNHRGDEFPPKQGLWLQEYTDGSARRDIYLDPDAKHFNTRPNMMASDGADHLYVASDKYVLRLNASRELSAYAKTHDSDAQIKAIIADGNNVWLFGEVSGDKDNQQQMWVERVEL